jgi:hypothetical protein
MVMRGALIMHAVRRFVVKRGRTRRNVRGVQRPTGQSAGLAWRAAPFTASGLPLNGVHVNTSTCLKRTVVAGIGRDPANPADG